MKLTQEYLKECLHYDQDTGIFTWKVRPLRHFEDGTIQTKKQICNIWNSRFANTITGSKSKKGYLLIGIDNKRYLAHRLAWLYIYGYCPENKVDHFDRNRSNNKISNLREVGNICSMQNTGELKSNKSGVKGVYMRKDTNKWMSYIDIHKDRIYLGSFVNFDDAVKARWEEERDNDLWTCWTDSSAYNHLKENNLLEEENEYIST